MRYLTPSLLRVMGTGIPLQQISDADLAGCINLAESEIDAYMHFREDQGVGFSLGVREERHKWNPVQRRVYPDSFPVPVRSLSLFEIVVSQQAATGAYISATVQPNNVVIQNDTGYEEPISLTVIAYGLTPVLAQLSVLGPFAHIIYTAGYTLTRSNYLLTSTGQPGQTYHSFMPQWDSATTPPLVFVNGSIQATGYTLDAASGSVTFSPSLAMGSVVTATFTSTIPDMVMQATRLAAHDRIAEYLFSATGMPGMSDLYVGGKRLVRQSDALRKEWKALLNPYRKPAIGLA